MSDWVAWQIVDSAFPTGGFAHSWGLEAAWQHGEVQTADDLSRFTDEAIVQAGYGVLPLVNAAFDDPGEFAAFDTLADAFLTSAIANRASRVQGRTLVATAVRVWPSPALALLREHVERTCAHAAPVSGAVFRRLGLPRPVAQRIVLYVTARGVLSAAVRLGIVGGYEAQRIQHACAAALDRVATECAGATIADLTQTAPLLDLLQARHDLLYSRLFQS